MKELLAQSENFKIYGSFEEAQLEGTEINGHIVVGDFYGQVECACIDQQERWCITGGNGLVIYQLEAPFEQYRYNHQTKQWTDMWRSDKDWYLEVIYQIEENVVRLVIDVFSEAKGVYDLNIETLELTKCV